MMAAATMQDPSTAAASTTDIPVQLLLFSMLEFLFSNSDEGEQVPGT
jgi:hypothetical protein